MPSIAPLDVDAEELGHVEWAGFVGRTPAFATVGGQVHLLADRHRAIAVHDGLLAACLSGDGVTLLTCGEDGRVCGLSAEGEASELYHAPGKWIDRIAAGPDGAVAFSWGRKGMVIAGGEEKPFECARTVEGLAFAPKGMRLAIARYDGVELRWINTANPPQFLEWKGAHTGVTFSPDGRYVVSTMQENALHGWRLADNRHMRMTGYPAKVQSVSWSVKGKWLATAGAPAAVTWPFSGKDGPMGRAPKELGAMGMVLVTRVACHPAEAVVAIGYEDGMVLAVRIEDGKEAILRRGEAQGRGGAISALGWDPDGKRLAYGTSGGEAGIVDLTG
ncbi:MAG: WD40 repeat domain-containing protein [Nitratireductor sp.]|nr:WD40 repeat domain-containing protein [Nitratireductor sp.]